MKTGRRPRHPFNGKLKKRYVGFVRYLNPQPGETFKDHRGRPCVKIDGQIWRKENWERRQRSAKQKES